MFDAKSSVFKQSNVTTAQQRVGVCIVQVTYIDKEGPVDTVLRVVLHSICEVRCSAVL